MNKKILSRVLNLMLTLVASLLPFACTTMGSVDVWNGISKEPIGPDNKIHSAAQLAWLADYPHSPLVETYTLETNINLGKHAWTPIGENFTSAFNGKFDGCNYTITGLALKQDVNERFIGLFGYTNGADIKNLKIQLNSNINVISSTSSVNIGVLAGYIVNSVIDNVSTNGSLNIISTTPNPCYAGGIVGNVNTNSKITNSSTNINITVNTVSDVYAGGITGSSSNDLIEKCHTSGYVTVTSNTAFAVVGGIVGTAYNNTNIKTCYTTSTITSKSNGSNTACAGGIAGSQAYITISSCYAVGNITAETDTSGVLSDAGGIVGISESGQIKDSATLSMKITAQNASINNASRIMGRQVGITTTFINNYANSDMTVIGWQTNPSLGTASNLHGEGHTNDDFKGSFMYDSTHLNWNTTDWNFYAYSFPTLK